MVIQNHFFLLVQQQQFFFQAFNLARYSLLTVVFFLLLLTQATPLWAQVSASTDRTVLSIDETIVLEIKSENSSGDPDLSELEQDFQILGRSQSQNYSLINGHASRTHIWNVTLLPKKIGEVTIPQIQVGNETTQAIHLVIQNQSNTPGLDGKEVFLKVELSCADNAYMEKNNFYVQQQILVKVQLFHRIRFSNASLSELELNNTVVEKLGNDSNYNKVIANQRYNVVERNYAIYPQQSGTLTLPALTFTGHAEISQNFSLFSRPGRQIISRTKPITLNILPIPENYTGKNWLPAENLLIESEILEDINSIKSGEAITRHIVIRATGLLGSQLPATTVPSSRMIKTYPDKEKLNTQLVNGKVIGTRRDTIAIIPLKSGRFTLPEIKIDWWNTKTNQQETAILPARSLLAQQNPDVATSTDNALSSDSEMPSQKKVANTEQSSEKIIYREISVSKNPWFWSSLALLIIWLITLTLLFFVSLKKKRLAPNTAAQRNSSDGFNHHEKYLQRLYDHCQENNAHDASRDLIAWAKHYFEHPMLSSLSQVIELIDNENLSKAINSLESSQYSANKQSWNGDALKAAIKSFIEQDKARKESIKQKAAQAFVPLNPNPL